MRAGLMATWVAVALVGCVSAQEVDVGQEAETFSGLFRQGFEQSDFYPDAGGGPWWFTDEGDLWSQIEPFASGTGRGVAVVVRMEVEGQVSAKGRHGHLGAYDRELIATRIVSLAAASEAEFEAAARRAAEE